MSADVHLRPWRPNVAPAIAAIRDEPHLRRWSSMGDDVPGWIERQRAGTRGPSWAICAGGQDAPLGKLAVRLSEHASEAARLPGVDAADGPVGELSYWTLPAARGRGLSVAAVRAALPWLARHTDLRSVVLDIEAGNAASARVAARLGARRCGPPRTHVDRLGEPHTMIVYLLAVR